MVKWARKGGTLCNRVGSSAWRDVQQAVRGGGGLHLASQSKRIHIIVASHSRRAGSPEGAVVVGNALQAEVSGEQHIPSRIGATIKLVASAQQSSCECCSSPWSMIDT